ncbi:MAG: chemotaxis protein CheB [Halioglobus sp.]
MSNSPDNTGKTVSSSFGTEVKAVWVLAGSAGASTAVQAFLNAFRKIPPVAFLYAQHFSVDEQQLSQLTPENPLFSMAVPDGCQSLAPGRVVMVPPSRKVQFECDGRLSISPDPWSGHFTPNIDELFMLLAEAQLTSSGVIIFSGMGSDGSAALPALDKAGAHIWAQSPASAICDSMPRSAIQSGLVRQTGDAALLALALEQLYN